MTIVAFGDYINSGGQIINKSSIKYIPRDNVDPDTLHNMGVAAATTPYLSGCGRFGAEANGIIANGRNNGIDVVYAKAINYYF